MNTLLSHVTDREASNIQKRLCNAPDGEFVADLIGKLGLENRFDELRNEVLGALARSQLLMRVPFATYKAVKAALELTVLALTAKEHLEREEFNALMRPLLGQRAVAMA